MRVKERQSAQGEEKPLPLATVSERMLVTAYVIGEDTAVGVLFLTSSVYEICNIMRLWTRSPFVVATSSHSKKASSVIILRSKVMGICLSSISFFAAELDQLRFHARTPIGESTTYLACCQNPLRRVDHPRASGAPGCRAPSG